MVVELKVIYEQTDMSTINVTISTIEAEERKPMEEILSELEILKTDCRKNINVELKIYKLELTRALPIYELLRRVSEVKQVSIKCSGYTTLSGIILTQAATPGYRLSFSWALYSFEIDKYKNLSKTFKLLETRRLNHLFKEIITKSDEARSDWFGPGYLLNRGLIDRIE